MIRAVTHLITICNLLYNLPQDVGRAVISNDKYNSSKLDAVVLAMTSNVSGAQYKVIVENKDLESGNLPLKSAVRVDKPFSISQSKVLKIQAKLNQQKFIEVKKTISKLIQ